MRPATLRVLQCLGGALVAALGHAQAPIVTTVLNHGSTATHYDLVILGDGYQAAEQAHFDQDVNTFLTGLFQKAPYSMLSGYFNVHSVFRASQDSGASHPDVTPPIVRNTAYGASYNTGGTARCLYITNTTRALADAALAPDNETRVLVMVNDTRYGGCASTFAVSYNGASMVEVQSHEMGHAVAGLADEYDYPNGNYTGAEPTRVNISADPVGTKWSHWWGVESVGAFQGAGYYLTGLYRPRSNCLMRNLGITLCPICREQITRSINTSADAIDNPLPATTSVTVTRPNTQTFSFTNLVPAGNNPVITWSLDGQVVANQTGTSYQLNTIPMNLGSHTVSVQVQDNTPEVRVDIGNSMRHVHSWSVIITDPNAANLHLVQQTILPQILPTGTDTTITVTVVNDGPGVANNFTVEHFLSNDGAVQSTDTYLGGTTIASLAAGQQLQIVRTVHIPAALNTGPWIVIGIADRAGTVIESNEVDNLSYATMLAQTGPCGPTLEYRDDLLYPKTQGAISIANGGTLAPTVVARCAGPGALYLLLWSCSGTSPGTVIAPGLTLPLIVDNCTLAGLQILNGSVLQGFVGPLDAQGVGRATLAIPAGLSLSTSTNFLAAVLLDANLQFTATTNAVQFDLVQ